MLPLVLPAWPPGHRHPTLACHHPQTHPVLALGQSQSPCWSTLPPETHIIFASTLSNYCMQKAVHLVGAHNSCSRKVQTARLCIACCGSSAMLVMLSKKALVRAVVVVGSHAGVGLRQLRITCSGSFAKLVMSSKKTLAHAGVLLGSHACARLRFDTPAVPD